MIRVTAPSRLHFGLLSLPPTGPPLWENALGEPVLPARRFGGVGLMVERPGLAVSVRSAADWQACGPLAGRAIDFARRFAQTVAEAPPAQLTVERCAPPHAGLGTGTQLGLAVARALALHWGLPDLGAVELARRVGRGTRSALGIHGFAQGGFLVDGGQGPVGGIGALVARADFPEEWRVVLVIPPEAQGLHGRDEAEAFERLPGGGWDLARTEALCRLVLLGMLPALREGDVQAFGEALYDFNRRVGEGFRCVQGGVYSRAQAMEITAELRRLGVRGVGQSSWGPSLFAVAGDPETAEHAVRRLGEGGLLGGGRPVITIGARGGASSEIFSENGDSGGRTGTA
jgi:beta-RFAP synthase